MANLAAIKTELDTDPLTRGYAGMTDEQAAASLSAADRTVNRDTLRAVEIFEAIDDAEYVALSAGDRSRVDRILDLAGDDIPVGPASRARAWLLAAFGAGTTTRTTLIAAVQETISRADELGLGNIRPGTVAQARSL